jgi:type IV pilus assembly protein PilC
MLEFIVEHSLEMTAITLLVLYIYFSFKEPAITLVTSPFVAFVLGFAGYIDDSIGVMIISPLIFLGTVMSVSISKREPESEGWPQIWAKWILIILIFLILSITVGAIFGSAGIIGSIFFILFISSIIAFFITSRYATAAYILSTIGSSIRQNLPLPMALEATAGGRSDKHSIILQRIKKWLVQGNSLSESIKRGYPKCPGHAIAMITAAEHIDQLPLAFSAIEADITTKADESRTIRPVHPFYPVIVLCIMFFILMSIIKFVIPQYKSVLEEMALGQLPFAMDLLTRVARFIMYDFGWLFWWLLLLIILFAIPLAISIRFRPRRPEKPYILSRIGDYIKWHLPVLRWFEKNYSMVQVVELLRLSLNAGYTVDDSIENTLELDVNNCFRKRLSEWLQRVKRGDNISTTIRESKLGSALAWAFDDRINQGNTLSILETLESFYRSNYSYYVNLARFILWPCLILLLGLIVGFVVYAIFSPSIAVIRSLSGTVYP